MTHALIIEDDVHTVLLLTTLLQHWGFEAFTSDNTVDALMVLENQSDIRLVTLDMLLPGLSGMSLLDTLRVKFPNAAVLIVSAVLETDQLDLVRLGDTPRLLKPFSKQQFDEAIHKLGVIPA